MPASPRFVLVVVFGISGRPVVVSLGRARIARHFDMRLAMKTVFRMLDYDMDCTPRATDGGRFAAQLVVTKVGFNPEKSFRELGEFDAEEAAVARAKDFAAGWLTRYG